MSSIINEFLKRSAQHIARKRNLLFVLGNEAGDMDTVVGSIYLAMYLEKTNTFGVDCCIPVLNFEKEDLPLRQDVVKLFSRHGISTEHLRTIKGQVGATGFIDLKQLNFSVVLYDHNKLPPDQCFLMESVVGIIDHHVDEGLYVEQTARLRRIEKTGSACTLVTELFQEGGLEIPCPDLLLAPIVVDTVNLDPSQKRVTERDIAATKSLVTQSNYNDYITTLFKDLMAWKQDIHGLTVPQHLRRDYKGFEFPFKNNGENVLRVGISSVACRFDELLSDHDVGTFASSCIDFIETRTIDALLLVFAGEREPGSYCRQLAFFAKDDALRALLTFCKRPTDGVEFKAIETKSIGGWVLAAYELSDPSVSRKRLVPSLGNFLLSWNSL
uniref:WGS project CAEQ00000000 data, annotated contig 1323 n=1 Tax=Trypanosoma congolense (strain IL3000) TaxID=1068625 RepID=F9W5F8_TRYCI|nr:unnamed protein product [Trypanosoma congolense IL3000]